MLSDRDYVHYQYSRPRSRQSTSTVVALIVANASVFLLTMMSGWDPRFGYRLNAALSLSSDTLMAGQVWRLATHMFAHGSLFHIAFNMWGLYIFGKPLEERVGSRHFLHLYFLSGLVGSLIWLVFNWTGIPVIGASGAVFGVLMAAAITFPNRQYMLLFPPIPMRLKTLAVVFGVIEIINLLSERGAGGIARLAHLGGMIGGYVYMRWFFRSSWGRHAGGPSGVLRSIRAWFRRKRFHPHQGYRHRHDADLSDNEPISSIQVDQVLDKIGQQGLSSLTRREREILEKARERLRSR